MKRIQNVIGIVHKTCCFMVNITVLVACSDAPGPRFEDLPAEINAIVMDFENQSRNRGIDVDLSNLSFEFRDLGEDKIGSCQTTANEHTVILDTNSIFWGLSGRLGHEELIFHELGHCILGRSHLDDTLVNGDFKSIMRTTGDASYFENKVIDINNSYKRPYYLNELFDPSTASPCWALNVLDNETQELIDVPFIIPGSMTVDNAGRFWVIAASELWRHNGESIDTYTEGLSTFTGSPANLFAGPEGIVWLITTEQDVIRIYNIMNEDFQLIDEIPNPANIHFFLNHSGVDNSGKLWSGGTGGLVLFPLDGTLQVFDHTNSELPDERITGLMILDSGELAITQDTGLTIFDGEGFISMSISGDIIVGVTRDSNNRLWIATEDELFTYSSGRVEPQDMFELNLPFPGINSLFTDQDDNLWVSSKAGLRKLLSDGFSEFCEFSSGLPGVNVRAAAVDGFGNIWTYSGNGGRSYLIRTAEE